MARGARPLLLLLAAVFVFFLLAACAAATSEQQIVGAFTPQEVLEDPDVVEAANFAVSSLGRAKEFARLRGLSLHSVLAASTQVVAGVNFFIKFIVKDSKNAKRTVEAVVYRPLPHMLESGEESAALSLTSYRVLPPGEDGAVPAAFGEAVAAALDTLNARNEGVFPYELDSFVGATAADGAALDPAEAGPEDTLMLELLLRRGHSKVRQVVAMRRAEDGWDVIN